MFNNKCFQRGIIVNLFPKYFPNLFVHHQISKKKLILFYFLFLVLNFNRKLLNANIKHLKRFLIFDKANK